VTGGLCTHAAECKHIGDRQRTIEHRWRRKFHFLEQDSGLSIGSQCEPPIQGDEDRARAHACKLEYQHLDAILRQRGYAYGAGRAEFADQPAREPINRRV